MTAAEVAIRPNGRRYRAIKRPAAHPYGENTDYTGSFGIVVIRTHDVDVAVPLAGRAWNYFYNDGDPLPAAHVGWTRLVPWDTGGGGEWSWDMCSGREAGTVPCVWFDSNDYRPLVVEASTG